MPWQAQKNSTVVLALTIRCIVIGYVAEVQCMLPLKFLLSNEFTIGSVSDWVPAQ